MAIEINLDNVQETLVSGTNIKTINSQSLLGSGDLEVGGAVDSVNGEVGVVVLDADDISDATTANKFVSASEKTIISNTSGTNTGDQDLSGLQATLVSGTNIKTINNSSILGSGNIGVVQSNTSGVSGADAITNLMSLTQAEYNAIGTPNLSTFYVITDA